MKHLKEGKLIAGNFTRALASFKFKKVKVGYDVMTNDSVVEGAIKEMSKNVRILASSWKSFVNLVHCDVFVGTYRSKLSTAVNMLRAVRGYLLNTDTGDLMEMSNSQAGLLSPYVQDVEDCEFTVNERLRGCRDNIDDLREILQRFVL
jgi:hypothetical protein